MAKRLTALRIRKTHRYLGVFLGLQFLMWTVSGLYFSWTNIDDIHGDQFRKHQVEKRNFYHLISPNQLQNNPPINTLQLKEINSKPYYWVNNKALYDAENGNLKNGIDKDEAVAIAKSQMSNDMIFKDVSIITHTDKHHEYREKLLPAYVITFKHDDEIKAYVSINDGTFQTVRHRNWRWFDFLWMTHTMDYEGRDDINNWVLRIFSALGLITVLSGFLLWYISSPRIRSITKSKRRTKVNSSPL